MNHPRLALAAGALGGAALALAGVLWPDQSTLETGAPAAAMVNGQPIPVEDVELALELIGRDSRGEIGEAEAALALERLIDEELLFQRALALDLPRNASTVRRSLVMTMIDLARADAPAQADEAELRAFFEENRAFFAGEDRVRIDWVSAAPGEADAVRPAAHPPDRLISASDLRRYLGAALSGALAAIEEGDTAGPIEAGGRRHWITVLERRAGRAPEFESVRDEVESLWRERAQEAALEAYLAELRAAADIRRQPVAPE